MVITDHRFFGRLDYWRTDARRASGTWSARGGHDCHVDAGLWRNHRDRVEYESTGNHDCRGLPQFLYLGCMAKLAARRGRVSGKYPESERGILSTVTLTMAMYTNWSNNRPRFCSERLVNAGLYKMLGCYDHSPRPFWVLNTDRWRPRPGA